MTQYAQRLWSREHFRFFPIYAIAVVLLTGNRLRDEGLPEEQSWRVGPVGLGVAVLLSGVSLWLGSPLAGVLSLLLLIDSLLVSWPAARRCWRLMFVLIALPMGYDQKLILKLQNVSSAAAGILLDRAGIPHLQTGNVLELASGRRLFVEEACSGIGSVYLLTAATLLYVVAVRERVVRGLSLLLTVPWWAVVGNILRICLIVFGLHWNDVETTSGWLHEVIGVLSMGLALAGIAATKWVLDFALNPIGDNRIPGESASRVLTPMVLWNAFTTPNRSLADTRETPARFTIPVRRRGLFTTLVVFFSGTGLAYWGTIGGMFLRQFHAENTAYEVAVSDDSTGSRQLRSFQRLDSNTFRSVPGLTTSDFRQEVRGERADRERFGAYSRIWTFRRDLLRGLISVDGPFSGWHDLRLCYEGQGWRFADTTTHQLQSSSTRHLVTVRMFDTTGRRAHLYFCLFRPSGELISPPLNDSVDGVLDSFRRRLKIEEMALNSECWQFQLLIESPGSSLETERQAERMLYEQLLASLLQNWSADPRESAADIILPEEPLRKAAP
ncbi:MAG: exosortase U [Planctomycetaceae bacterium]|nr:exosortase U [Planctomycetaceae bacterium]